MMYARTAYSPRTVPPDTGRRGRCLWTRAGARAGEKECTVPNRGRPAAGARLLRQHDREDADYRPPGPARRHLHPRLLSAIGVHALADILPDRTAPGHHEDIRQWPGRVSQ